MKTALITGASQGIGAAVVDKLNDKKIKVILVSRSKSKLKTFQKNLKFPKNSLIISKDLRSLSVCNSIAKKIKKLDYLINVFEGFLAAPPPILITFPLLLLRAGQKALLNLTVALNFKLNPSSQILSFRFKNFPPFVAPATFMR